MADSEQPLSFRADRIEPSQVERLAFVLDMQAQLPDVRRLRAWALDALSPAEGERAVDVGSGTGSEVLALAARLGPTGEAIGVEPNAGLRDLAEQRAAEAAEPNVRFVEGDAYALPFEDASVDVVRCERVLQHLEAPERAVAEVARVLKPGGRVCIIDSDWGTAILHPADPAVVRAAMESMHARLPNPFSGRLLRGQLSTAGLVVDDIGSQALVQPLTAAEGPLVQMLADRALADGAIDEDQHTQLLHDLRAGAAAGDFHMSVTMFAALAHQSTHPPVE
ncbi:methyltransferase domain-containing protein [Luteipulveratus mongoliensis]|uniref:Methyltransferase n=1 Tax=Luteipulveratus mongoliensis TaxID=571913 RepID=A0A0K1JNV7_9MICO|nr:methyltransferase domain-containing protein [Luteipulveratus mongoliensis]AKU18402.1 methyltransferase [Luteipulveratus mongoliensis]